jgi:hypothetical protein
VTVDTPHKIETSGYDNFPVWIALLAWVLSLSIYVLGAYILMQVGIWVLVFYIPLCVLVEWRILKESCPAERLFSGTRET